MKIYLYLISSVLFYSNVQTAQPYFPPQIIFSPGVDEINQQAYIIYPVTPSLTVFAYVLQHFPYAPPDTPQSKYYVQLVDVSTPNFCAFGTYWKYGGDVANSFPSHCADGASFEIKNYMNYSYEMIHSNESLSDEDYWYSNEKCQDTAKQTYPCQEVYFKKNTDIPLRFIEVRRAEAKVIICV